MIIYFCTNTTKYMHGVCNNVKPPEGNHNIFSYIDMNDMKDNSGTKFFKEFVNSKKDTKQ